MKLPPVWAIAVCGLLFFAISFGAFEFVRERQQGRDADDELRVIDRVCAFWKSDTRRFADCGNAYRVYLRCETDRIRRADEADARKNAGACEDPVYRFHQREQQEIEQIEHSVD